MRIGRIDSHSLTVRLVSWYSAGLLLLGGLFIVCTYIAFSNYLQAVMRDALATRALEAASLARPLIEDPIALGSAIRARFTSAAYDRFLRVSVQGVTLYRSARPSEGQFDPDHLAPSPAGTSGLRTLGALWIYTRVEELPDGRLFAVETGQLDSLPSTAKKALLEVVLVALPILLLIVAYGGFRLVRNALAPVSKMSKAAEALTFNSPQKRLPSSGTGDVIDELGRTLNRMLVRLDSAYQHAHKFSGDAAHELRTPLAIMRGELEYLTSQPALTSEQHTALENALNETIRLGLMVEDLLSLNLVEGVGGKRAHVPVELGALASETVEQMRLLAEEKHISLGSQRAAVVTTLADPARLTQVLVNLIDNAVKYTAPGGQVIVDARKQDGSAMLEVRDTGIGIACKDQPYVFERFFRVNPDRGSRGTGLGLAIARSICLAHGGSLELESAIGQGSTFRVRLPLEPDTADSL